MSQKFRQFYFNTNGVSNNTLSEFTRMISDIRYNYAIDLTVRLHANHTNGRIYYYK